MLVFFSILPKITYYCVALGMLSVSWSAALVHIQISQQLLDGLIFYSDIYGSQRMKPADCWSPDFLSVIASKTNVSLKWNNHRSHVVNPIGLREVPLWGSHKRFWVKCLNNCGKPRTHIRAPQMVHPGEFEWNEVIRIFFLFCTIISSKYFDSKSKYVSIQLAKVSMLTN